MKNLYFGTSYATLKETGLIALFPWIVAAENEQDVELKAYAAIAREFDLRKYRDYNYTSAHLAPAGVLLEAGYVSAYIREND